MRVLRTVLWLSLVLALIIAGTALAQRKAIIPSDVELIRDVEYGKGGDVSLKLDIVRPKTPPSKPMPVVIFVHGGGWQSGSKESAIPLLVPLARKGCFCVTINYRLTDVAPFPAQIEDCKCAVRWVRAHAKTYNLDAHNIGAWGASAGGHLVALLGTSAGVQELEGKGGWAGYSSRVHAVADYFGPADFLYWAEEVRKTGVSIEELERTKANNAISKLFGGPFSQKLDVARQASPITYVDRSDPPFFIAHGDQDNLVPLSQSKVFYEALKKNGVDATLHVVKGAGHGFARQLGVEDLVYRFFDKHLRGVK